MTCPAMRALSGMPAFPIAGRIHRVPRPPSGMFSPEFVIASSA